MSQELVMSFVRVPLIAAALVLSIGSATAGESTDNLQQIRELLAGRVATHAARASAPQPADAQQLAREVLLGITKSNARDAVPATPSEARRPRAISANGLLAHDDAQAMARRLLLGRAPTGS
jgi:hypothetical protein